MLLDEHTRGERPGRVAGQNGHACLAEHGAGVEFRRHEVDGAARLRIARGDRARVRVEALVGGQQRGVNIDDARRPACDECGREQAHVAGERNQPDALMAEERVHLGLERRLAAARGAGGEGRDALRRRPGDARRIGIVGGHGDDVIPCRGLDERYHVRPAAGKEDPDVHHTSPRTRSEVHPGASSHVARRLHQWAPEQVRGDAGEGQRV